MPDLLLELFSEEIPARMQRKAAGDLKRLVTEALVNAGLTYEGAKEHWTPRRLTLDLRGLTAKSADVTEERKGPRTDAPEKAIEGFLRGAGLTSIDEATVQTDPKKGDFYVAITRKPGRAAEEIIADIMPGIIHDFPWPKSMRWGRQSSEAGSLRWVRPLQSILCTFGPETEEPVVVDFEVGGMRSGNTTRGHRFHAGEPFTVRRFDDYVEKLERDHVILDAGRRRDIIATDARNLAFANGVDLVEDEGLLDEVSGLVEWPVVLMGEFDAEFLSIPDEVIRLTIKTNQKCFVCREQGSEKLSNKFILVSNIDAKDGGVDIARGNGKVVRARLSDALHFWATDQADLPDLKKYQRSIEKFDLDATKPLDQRMAKLDHLGVTFHAKLGTQGERVQRIAALAEDLAPIVGADPAKAKRAAILAKADLTTEAVGEFPDLQGAMGRKYALLQGEDESVAAAIEDHYKPQGPSDAVPTDPVAIAVALADKLDTLTGFWAIDEKPTGSKDPYALRRAALGVIRILVENGIGLRLLPIMVACLKRLFQKDMFFVFNFENLHDSENLETTTGMLSDYLDIAIPVEIVAFESIFKNGTGLDSLIRNDTKDLIDAYRLMVEIYQLNGGKRTEFAFFLETSRFEKYDGIDLDFHIEASQGILDRYFLCVALDLLSFFHDRLKVYLRDQGARHDLIDAVLGAGSAAQAPLSPLVGEMSSQKTEGGNLNDDLLLIVRKVEALQALLETETGANLLAGTKRAMNILAAEEKKDGDGAFDGAVTPALFAEPAEKELHNVLDAVKHHVEEHVARDDHAGAFGALADLRPAVDAFFEGVMVNADDAAVRENRLRLLASLRATTRSLADFSKIAG